MHTLSVLTREQDTLPREQEHEYIFIIGNNKNLCGKHMQKLKTSSAYQWILHHVFMLE